MTQLQSSTVAAGQLTPARARQYVTARCDQLPADALDVVRLLTTELVSNALVHGRGDVQLDIQVQEDLVTVGVTDSGAGEVRAHTEDRWPEGRHGLRLVSALADRWGVQPCADTLEKRVWFELNWLAGSHTIGC